MSIDLYMNLAKRVEPVIYLRLTEFLERIIIQELKVAIKGTKKNISDLILWLDGLKEEEEETGAVVI